MKKKLNVLEEITSIELDKENPLKESSLKRIGNLIKEARISRNQSIDDLAANLKMGSHQLRALEEGNEDLLPEKVFIKAMVRRVSEKLKIDNTSIMNELNTERKEVKVEEIMQEGSTKAKRKKMRNKNKSMGFVVIILISGILGLIASSLIFDMFSNSSLKQIPKQELLKKN